MSAKILTLPLITLALIFTLTIGSVAASDTYTDTTCTSNQNNNHFYNENHDLGQDTCDNNCPNSNEDECTDNPTECTDNPTECTDNPTDPTDNSNNNGDDSAADGKVTTVNDPSIVKASATTDKIPLQKTGVPVAPLALAVMSIFAGFIAPKIR